MFFISTTIPYVNGTPHLGHLLEVIFNDSIARYQRRLMKDEVWFCMGLDQHGQKIYKKSKEEGLSPEDYINKEKQKFTKLWKDFEISNDVFVETATIKHKTIAQIAWQKLAKKNLIYKKSYSGLYCVGDESFVSKGQLRENGMCPNHNEFPVEMQEENYFFKLSKFQDVVREYVISADIRPKKLKQEILNFLDEGLEDLSISRDKSQLPWGVPVLEDEGQVMYVWFEALVNYLTAVVDEESVDKYLEFPLQKSEFEKEIWDQIQKSMPTDFIYMGKDMWKFHLIIWPAILYALDLPPIKVSQIHGFINDNQGRKFSKSLGNGVFPEELITKFGIDGARFVMLHEMNLTDDTDFNWERVMQSYNSNLADNLGNLVVRVSNLIEKYFSGLIDLDAINLDDVENYDLLKNMDMKKIYLAMEDYNPPMAMREIFIESSKINEYLEQTKPWTLAKDWDKNEDRVRDILTQSAKSLVEIGKALSLFLPLSGQKIYETFTADRIVKAEILFPKIEMEEK
jgi:methionyl-tRNA synthetase